MGCQMVYNVRVYMEASQVGKVTHLGGVTCLSLPDHMHMIGGETRRGGLHGLPDQVTLLARVKFGHVKV